MCYIRSINTPRPYLKVALFVVGLAVVFVASVAIGSAFDPAGGASSGTEETMDAHAMETDASHGATEEPAGLGISADGRNLRLAATQFERGRARQLRFTIEDADGQPLTEFDELHERSMHLIVVRRDGAEFRHLHPEIDESGTWTVPVSFDKAGVYRAFADFSADGEQETLAADLFVSGGDFEARPFPAPRALDSTDGYEVRLAAGAPRAGEHSELSFAVGRDGRPVDDLAPYLGAKGHLVALREGDLAFLHVHPEEGESAPNEIVFDATFPTAGRYRLYLQFKHEGAVRTVEYTVEVSG
jgi:hypothetical protein